MPEILRISDRVLIMRAGKAPVMLEREGLTEEIIMQHAIAAKVDQPLEPLTPPLES